MLLKNAMVFTNGKFQKYDVEINESTITKISKNIESKDIQV